MQQQWVVHDSSSARHYLQHNARYILQHTKGKSSTGHFKSTVKKSNTANSTTINLKQNLIHQSRPRSFCQRWQFSQWLRLWLSIRQILGVIIESNITHCSNTHSSNIHHSNTASGAFATDIKDSLR